MSKLPQIWNQAIAYGWLLFFAVFLGLDCVAWMTRSPRIPTFSRVVGKLLPWYVTLGLCAALFVHFALIYWEQ